VKIQGCSGEIIIITESSTVHSVHARMFKGLESTASLVYLVCCHRLAARPVHQSPRAHSNRLIQIIYFLNFIF
jgi:hypothetical protein